MMCTSFRIETSFGKLNYATAYPYFLTVFMTNFILDFYTNSTKNI